MKLRLSVTTGNNAFSDHRESHEFTELGGTIGRASRNDWVIPDPTRVVSGTHAQVDYVDGQFQLTDTSTNGVYVNGSDLALGRDSSIPLSNGDRFQIGDFEIAVAVEEDDAATDAAQAADAGLPPWPIEDAGDSPAPVLPDNFGQQPAYWGETQSDQVPDLYGHVADLGSVGVAATAADADQWDFSSIGQDAGGAPPADSQASGDALPDDLWSTDPAAAGMEPADPISEPSAPLTEQPSEQIPTDFDADKGSAPAAAPEAPEQTGPRPASGPPQTPPRQDMTDALSIWSTMDPMPPDGALPAPSAPPPRPSASHPGAGYDLSTGQRPATPQSLETPGRPQDAAPASEPLDFELPDLGAVPTAAPSASGAAQADAEQEPADPDETAPYGRDEASGQKPVQPPITADAQAPTPPQDAPPAPAAPPRPAAAQAAQPAFVSQPPQRPPEPGPDRSSPPPGLMPPQPAWPRAAPPQRPAAPQPPGPATAPPQRSAPVADAAVGMEAALAELLKGAGVPGLAVPHGASPETFRAIGELLALYAGGTAELLGVIGSIKNTFRINQTQIQQRDNNPLRWVATPREAVKRLLAPEDDGYLAPREAVSDALASIKAHQMGSIHGMQEAFKEFLNDLEPEELKSSFDRQGRPGPLANKGAWYWARYADFHRRLLDDAQNNVLDLIGSTFSTAYEQQVQNVRKQSNGHG